MEVHRREGVQAPGRFADYQVTFHQSRLPAGGEWLFLINEGGGAKLVSTAPEGVVVD